MNGGQHKPASLARVERTVTTRLVIEGSQFLRVTFRLADSTVHLINVIDDPQKPRVDRILTKALAEIFIRDSRKRGRLVHKHHRHHGRRFCTIVAATSGGKSPNPHIAILWFLELEE